jgi:hypothetical protein
MVTKPTDPSHIHTIEAAGSCSKCSWLLGRLVDCSQAYFEQGYVTCTHCGEHVDLWAAALGNAVALAPTGWALASLGAAQTSVVMPMESGKIYEVRLTDYGAPPDARILSTNYTGQTGNLTAIEWHGNTPRRRAFGTVLHLLAVPLGEVPLPCEGKVAIRIVWIRRDDSDAWPYLVTAFEATAAGDYPPSLVFAQSAAEVSMMPLIEQRIRRHASTERVKNFMRDSLTYSHALNVLLPYLCGEIGIAQMPEAIRGALNKMRKRRNDIIHEGTKTADITANEAIEGLCAAAFGFEYMRYVGPALLAGS